MIHPSNFTLWEANIAGNEVWVTKYASFDQTNLKFNQRWKHSIIKRYIETQLWRLCLIFSELFFDFMILTSKFSQHLFNCLSNILKCKINCSRVVKSSTYQGYMNLHKWHLYTVIESIYTPISWRMELIFRIILVSSKWFYFMLIIKTIN